MRLECRTVNHINWPLEETGDILFEAHVIVDCAFGAGFKLHQYIEVAVRPVVASHNRAKYGGVRHATRTQGALVTAKRGKGVLNVHIQNIAENGLRREILTECRFSNKI
jgi:hypothetical protein